MVIVVEHQENVLKQISFAGVDISAKTSGRAIRGEVMVGNPRALPRFAGAFLRRTSRLCESSCHAINGMKHDRKFDCENFCVLGDR